MLKALLPESGTDIKGQMRSRQNLLVASGYASRPRDFDELIHVLDRELRLITPTDPEGPSSEGPQTATSGQYYQLAHDYLVHSLRDWLTRKQRETPRGRAELRLSERSASWNAKPENRHLPSGLEWANISLLTKKKDWTERERRMMNRARRVHGSRALGSIILVALIAWGGIEGYGTLRAAALVESLQKAGTPEVPAIIEQLSGYRRWADTRLVRALERTDAQSRAHLSASLALLPVDSTQVDYLFSRLIAATPTELPVLRDALKTRSSALTAKLWAVLESAKPGETSLLPAASALASYAPGDSRWEREGGKVAEALVSVNSVFVGSWLEALRPVRAWLVPQLAAIFQDKSRSESVHSLATDILTDYASRDPDRLAELLMVAEPKAYLRLFPVAEKWAATVVPLFQAELSRDAMYSWNDQPFDQSWTKPDAALESRIELAQGILTERFAFCQTMPLDEFLTTAEALRKSGYRPTRFRPYALGKMARVAAVWTRDRRSWRIDSGLTALEARQQDERSKHDKLVPVDVAGYLATDKDGKPADRYAALWVEKSGDDDARLYVGMTAQEQDEFHNKLKEAELTPRTQHAMLGSDGRTRYCGVWGKPPAPFITGQTRREAFQGNFEQQQANLSDEVLVDVAIHAEDFDLDALRDDPAFVAIMKSGHSDRRYASVWNSDSTFEAISLDGLLPDAHLRKCQKLVAQGYRPVSWSASQTTTAGAPVTASVWHRPVIGEEAKDKLAERQARAAIALVRLDKADEVWPLLRHSADPRLRSFIVNWLSPLGADPKLIAAELDRIDSSPAPTAGKGQPEMDAVLFDPGISMRRALILALGTYGTERLSAGEREPLMGKLLDLHRNDPDSGIHGASEWTLRRWNQQERLQEADAELMKLKDRGDRRWYVNSQRQTYALIEGPVEFRMGSPLSEPKHDLTMETARRLAIPRHFAIAAKEITIEQWQRFERTNPHLRLPPSFVNQYSPDPDGPRIGVTWYSAAHYCNWLSEQEGLPRDQWCYVPAPGGGYGEGMTIPADVLERRGYRLPTEAEWEYACRAGAVTSRYYGHSIAVLDAYARQQSNSNEHAWSCGSLLPNDLGLFDMLGNDFEWVQDRIHRPMPETRGVFSDLINIAEVLNERSPRLLRGGAFFLTPSAVRSALRLGSAPSYFYHYSGFRPARTYQ